MSWIDRIIHPLAHSRREAPQKEGRRSNVPEGMWLKCPGCKTVLYRPQLEDALNVCSKCGFHMRLGARRRLDLFLDQRGREELTTDVLPVDHLKFKDLRRYRDRLQTAQKKTGETDALVVFQGTADGLPLVAAAFEFSFHGGSMGYAVGERFTRAAALALQERWPLVSFSASGGARMQEGIVSLMQMAKTSAQLEKLRQAGVPYVSVITDPVYGGVSASLAMLGDVNIAEPGARSGFAGPNIIRQTTREQLPEGFQSSEFLLEHGAIDMIVERQHLRSTIVRLLRKLHHSRGESSSEEDQ